jgi:hypothetical protein
MANGKQSKIKGPKDVTLYDVYLEQIRLRRTVERFIQAILDTGKGDDLSKLEEEVGK